MHETLNYWSGVSAAPPGQWVTRHLPYDTVVGIPHNSAFSKSLATRGRDGPTFPAHETEPATKPLILPPRFSTEVPPIVHSFW
jgi:hypothetical protein